MFEYPAHQNLARSKDKTADSARNRPKPRSPERLFEEDLWRQRASRLDRKDEVVFHPPQPKLDVQGHSARLALAITVEWVSSGGDLIGPTALADTLSAESAVAGASSGGAQRSSEVFDVEHVHRALGLQVLCLLALHAP